MAEGIVANELTVGDVFINPRFGTSLIFSGPRRVTKIRDLIVGGGTYRVVEYDVMSGGSGQIDLREDVAVIRLRPVTLMTVTEIARDLADGTKVTFYRSGDTLWV